MRTITLEEHFASPKFLEGPGREIEDNPRRFGNVIPSKLYDIGEGRIADMDAAGIDLQVLSLNYPGVQQLEAASAIETPERRMTILRTLSGIILSVSPGSRRYLPQILTSPQTSWNVW